MIPTITELNYLLQIILKQKLVEDITNKSNKTNTKIYTDLKRRIYIQSKDNIIKNVHTEIYYNYFKNPLVIDDPQFIFLRITPIRESILIKENTVKKLQYDHVDNNMETTTHTFNLSWNNTVNSYNDCSGNYWDKDMNMEEIFLTPDKHIQQIIHNCVNDKFNYPIQENDETKRIQYQINKDMVALLNMKRT